MGYGIGIFGKRQVQRAPSNPLDKSTVVSIYPRPIEEKKPTIEPGIFRIDAGSFDKPAILIVGSSSWWRDIDPEQPLLEIPCWSIQVADSIIKDYANGLFMCNMGDSMPGLFFVEGKVGLEEVKTKHVLKLVDAKNKQNKWFENLIKAADILWARTNGNPISISDDMRLAAEQMNLKEKPWMRDFTTMTLVNCMACGTLARPGFPVCPTCHHIIDEKLYKELKLTKVS